MQERDLEQLVEAVARLVQKRLQQRGGANAQPTHGSACSVSAGGSECGPCGSRVHELISAGAERVGTLQTEGLAAGVPAGVASAIDHTLLKPEATTEDVRTICDEARRHNFASVCVNSSFVPLARSFLAGTPVKVVAVVGFPLGATLPAAKAYEACEAVRNGADEIDMVINIGALKSRDYPLVHQDIRMVVEASRPAPVKVILETSKLDDDEKVAACALSKAAGASFVKTSTGFGGGGATEQDVALMRRVVGPALGVKASGGVRTREQAEAMLAAGATRIGASASVAIVTGKGDSGKGY